MSVCPVCNGIKKLHAQCPTCQHLMSDQGRLMDYFDDYSAYMSIELMKEIDGIQNDKSDGKCPHLLLCESCKKENVTLVNEEYE